MDTRAYQPYTLVGPLVLQSVQDPLSAYTSTTKKFEKTQLHTTFVELGGGVGDVLV